MTQRSAMASRVWEIAVFATDGGNGTMKKTRTKTMIDKYNEVGIDPIETLERINQSKAKPMTKCIYPKCEECDKYHGHYCTVPMVISKQIWCEIAEKMHKLEQRLTELETLVTDEIFASEKTARPRDEELNLTWADVLGEDE